MPNMWILIVSSGSPYPQETVDILLSKAVSSLIEWALSTHFMPSYLNSPFDKARPRSPPSLKAQSLTDEQEK